MKYFILLLKKILWENHHNTTISLANAYSMSFFVCFLFMKCVQEFDYGS
jgi:hypothetical protein